MFQRNTNSTDDTLSKLIWIESEMIRKQLINNIQENPMLVNDDWNNNIYTKFNNEDSHFTDLNSTELDSGQYIELQSFKVYQNDIEKNTSKNDRKSFPSHNHRGGRQDPGQNDLRPSYTSRSMQDMDWINKEDPSNTYGIDPRQLPPQNSNQPSLNKYGNTSRQDPAWNVDGRQSNIFGNVSIQNTAWNGKLKNHNSGAKEVPSGSIELPSSDLHESTISQEPVWDYDDYSESRSRQTPIVNEHSNIYENYTWKKNSGQKDERLSQSSNAYRNYISQDPGLNTKPSSSKDHGRGIKQGPDQDSKGLPLDMKKYINGRQNPERTLNSQIYNRDIRSQGKPSGKSWCSNDLSMVIKYIKRLIYAFNKLKDDVPKNHVYQDILIDLVNDAKRFLQNPEKSNRSSQDSISILKKYDYYRKTYYCLRDKINADNLMARRDFNSCDNECSDEEYYM